MARQVTLVVEDGTIVNGANSFVTETEIIAYALARGVTLPSSTDPELDAVAVLGIKAMDYLWALRWRGEVVDPTQTTPWPRKNMNVTPAIGEDEIPFGVKEAQLQLTLLSNAGTVLVPVSLGTGLLIKEKIGPIENVYSDKEQVSSDGLPILPGVTSLLWPWLLGDLEGIVPLSITSVGPGWWRNG